MERKWKPHKTTSEVTQRCYCNVKEGQAERNGAVLCSSLSLPFRSHHDKGWENIFTPSLCVIFTLVKHAGVGGQTDLSKPSAPSLWSHRMTPAEVCITLSSNLFWKEL